MLLPLLCANSHAHSHCAADDVKYLQLTLDNGEEEGELGKLPASKRKDIILEFEPQLRQALNGGAWSWNGDKLIYATRPIGSASNIGDAVAFERPLPSQQLGCEPRSKPVPRSMSCAPPVSGPLDGETLETMASS